MFEQLSKKERYSLTGIFAAAVLVAFGAGNVSADGSITEAFMADSEMSESEIKERMQSVTNRQIEIQRQQLQQIANSTENLTREDVSISSEIKDVSKSGFGSLYKVNVSVTGNIPNTMGGGTQSIDENQVMYVSSDGRYLFQEPTDLEQSQQQTVEGR